MKNVPLHLPSISHASWRPLLTITMMSTLTIACTQPSSPADVDIEITATGGFGGSDSGGGADEGLDETGGDPTPVQDTCLFDHSPGQYGYKYQCVGSFTLQIVVNDQDPEPLFIEFGTAASNDSYEEPHVMACCPEYEGPTCAEPHEQACVVDMIEQGCKSLVPRLTLLAEDRPLLKEPILKTAEWIAQPASQTACLNAFLLDTGVATTAPSCDEDNNSVFDFDDAIDGAVWTFNPTTTDVVDLVELTVLDPQLWDWVAPGEPPQPETCLSADDNDHLSFLEVDPTVGEVKAKLTAGNVLLHGPSVNGDPITGQATFASTATACSAPYCSRSAWTTGAEAGELHSMSLFSDAPAEIGTPEDLLTVDSFQIHLFSPARGVVSANTLTIPAGEALFVMSGQALGESRWVPAWNATAIEIRPVRDYWSVSGFTVDYEDAEGDIWSMTLAPSVWR